MSYKQRLVSREILRNLLTFLTKLSLKFASVNGKKNLIENVNFMQDFAYFSLKIYNISSVLVK